MLTIWVLVLILTAPLLPQLPANASEKVVEDGLNPWAPRDLEGDPGFWLHPGSVLAITDIWGMTHGTKDLSSLCLSLSLSLC